MSRHMAIDDDRPNEDPHAHQPSVLPLWAMPIIVFGGLVLAVSYAPDSIEDLYVGRLLPFLISTWVGLGFSFTWDMLSASMSGAPKSLALATTLLSILVLLHLAGGIQVIWEEPWFLGVAIVPGARLALHYARSHKT
jgi:hypothetical protein